jgi:drug/metabolite transporter (DMT)-like permease
VPLTSLLLVLLAAICHASWNLLAKRAASAGAAFLFFSGLGATALYAPWAAYLIAAGKMTWSWPVTLCIAASGAIHLGYSVALQRGYRAADLSVVYPIARGTGPLLSSLAAILFLAESASVLRLSGLAAVVAGIVLIASNGRLDTFVRPEARAGLGWGALTGSLIASYTVVDGFGVKRLGIAPVLLDWFAGARRMAFLLPLVARDWGASRARMRGLWREAAGVAVLSPLGYILVLGAMQQGAPISVVAPARELSMMVGTLLGFAVLGEKVGPARLGGCALMVAGVVALGLC